MYEGAEAQLHAFLVSALDGGEWSVSRLGRFITGEKVPDTHWIGNWVGPRAGLDAVGETISATAGKRTEGRLTRSLLWNVKFHYGSSEFLNLGVSTVALETSTSQYSLSS
jgi:hypothetical protein